MPEGRVIEWTPMKGFGVIQGDEGTPAFVHHAQISVPGFKNLVDGQRVRYDVRVDPRGVEAINVVPLPLVEIELSPEEWKRMEPRCAAEKIAVTTRDSADPWKRPRVTLTADLQHHEALSRWVDDLQEDLKEGQPDNPVFIVDFQFGEGAGSGWCAAGADSAEAAEALVKSKLKDLLPEGVEDGEVVESMTLEEYEEELRRALPLSCYPKPGEVQPLG